MIIFPNQSRVLTRQKNDDVTRNSSLVCPRVVFLREGEQCERAWTSVNGADPGTPRCVQGFSNPVLWLRLLHSPQTLDKIYGGSMDKLQRFLVIFSNWILQGPVQGLVEHGIPKKGDPHFENRHRFWLSSCLESAVSKTRKKLKWRQGDRKIILDNQNDCCCLSEKRYPWPIEACKLNVPVEWKLGTIVCNAWGYRSRARSRARHRLLSRYVIDVITVISALISSI